MNLDNWNCQLNLINQICSKSMHIAILGKRESGKTCLGMAILDWHHKLSKKTCMVYQHPQPNLLPSWIHNITDLKLLTSNIVLLVDESSNDFDKYSYAKQSNRFLMQKLKKARQLNISFVFVDHSSDFLNKNMLKLLDVWLLKENTDYSIQDERPAVRGLYLKMERLPRLNEFWVHTDEFEGIMKFDKPEWYTEQLSMCYDVHDMTVTNANQLVKKLCDAKKAKNPKKAKNGTKRTD